MATATAAICTTVTLELSADEAQALAEVLGSVGGAGEGRQHISSVSNALANIGFNFTAAGPNCPVTGLIQFVSHQDRGAA